ncbi:BlaI/MecI/CopY family transcriptional regulator [Victivallis sp. Marseille-Q1083]|uniref:BlaI/MecI/CopY family transcriptional regulator n=1 Tax=Victivallis sp. Marseille-Q1083 TaxID=2717288 RepID=UPI00158BFBE1|nr:BlaI/MecI/CopY family transcriptional regulator [Victivallis sp. Marseille-Q1083]
MERIKISDAELEVMKALWDKSPQTLPEIVGNVQRENSWEGVTIKTLLLRLLKKEAVSQEGERRSYQYSPRISREEYLKEASNKFLRDTFQDTPGALLSFFVKERRLSSEELSELKAIIEEAEGQCMK